jgi:hypothetical protein
LFLRARRFELPFRGSIRSRFFIRVVIISFEGFFKVLGDGNIANNVGEAVTTKLLESFNISIS